MTTSEVARFWTKVNKTDTCWLWTREVNNKGYGVFRTYRKNGTTKHLAHRYALASIGVDIMGHAAMHSCDTPLCVKPAHLSLGTQAANIADMREKNRNDDTGLRNDVPHDCRFCSALFYAPPNRRYCDDHSQAVGLKGVPSRKVGRERRAVSKTQAA